MEGIEFHTDAEGTFFRTLLPWQQVDSIHNDFHLHACITPLARSLATAICDNNMIRQSDAKGRFGSGRGRIEGRAAE